MNINQNESSIKIFNTKSSTFIFTISYIVIIYFYDTTKKKKKIRILAIKYLVIQTKWYQHIYIPISLFLTLLFCQINCPMILFLANTILPLVSFNNFLGTEIKGTKTYFLSSFYFFFSLWKQELYFFVESFIHLSSRLTSHKISITFFFYGYYLNLCGVKYGQILKNYMIRR